MPDTRVSSLPTSTAPDGTEVVLGVQGGVSKKIPVGAANGLATLGTDGKLKPSQSATVGVLANDPIVWVSKSSKASDTNDGLSLGTAKATLAGALTALAGSAGRIKVSYGTFSFAAADGNGNGITLATVGTILDGCGEYLTSLSTDVDLTYAVCLRAAHCEVRNLQVKIGTGRTVTYGVGVTTVGSTQDCIVSHVLVEPSGTGVITNAFAVGPDTNGDVAETTFFACKALNPSTTGWLLGTGTAGNVLNVRMYSCVALGGLRGVHARSTNFHWFGGTVQAHTAADFHLTTPVATSSITGVRSEGSNRLIDSGGPSAALNNVTLKDVAFNASVLNADGRVINWQHAGFLGIDNLKVTNAGAALPVIRVNSSGSLAILTRGVSMKAAVAAAIVSGGGTNTITHQGFTQVDGTDVVVAVTRQWPLFSAAEKVAGVTDAAGGATVDVEARAALNTLMANMRTQGILAT